MLDGMLDGMLDVVFDGMFDGMFDGSYGAICQPEGTVRRKERLSVPSELGQCCTYKYANIAPINTIFHL